MTGLKKNIFLDYAVKETRIWLSLGLGWELEIKKVHLSAPIQFASDVCMHVMT